MLQAGTQATQYRRATRVCDDIMTSFIPSSYLKRILLRWLIINYKYIFYKTFTKCTAVCRYSFVSSPLVHPPCYTWYTHKCITLCCRCFNVRLSLQGVDVTSVGTEVHILSVCWNTAESRQIFGCCRIFDENIK